MWSLIQDVVLFHKVWAFLTFQVSVWRDPVRSLQSAEPELQYLSLAKFLVPSPLCFPGCSHKPVVGFTKYPSAHIQFISHCMESPWRLMSNTSPLQIPFFCVHSNPHLSPFSSAILSTDQCNIFLESVSRHKARIKMVFTSSVFFPSGITGWHCFSFYTLKIIPI